MDGAYRGPMRRLLSLAAVLAGLAALAAPGPASASPYVRYGIQDDAWLEYGPGTLAARLETLSSLGETVMRVTIDWNDVEPTRGADDWSLYDTVLDGLHEHGISPLVTLWGTPRWANGGRGPNWAPTSGSTFAAFAAQVATRYPFVHLWAIWDEPNQQRFLRPTIPATYVRRLLNPAYAAIHRVSPGAQVAGGVTAPRASSGGVSPVVWIAGMAAAHAKLDAYAHNPYPLDPRETPTSGGCSHCTTITMSTIDRLLACVRKAFGARTRIWLTEYGYQTNPPDHLLGVSDARQALYVSEAALRAYQVPRVDILIQYLVRDEPDVAEWQSGLETAGGAKKPSYRAFELPFAQASRSGRRTVVWAQVRPGGTRAYRLQVWRDGGWRAVGGSRTTSSRGFLTRTLNATPGTRLRVWVPSTRRASLTLTVR